LDIPEMKVFNVLSNSKHIVAVEGRRWVAGVSSASARETTQLVVKAPKCMLSVIKRRFKSETAGRLA
jgi:hypothetical protein